MPSGFEVINPETGSTLIDSVYSQMAFIVKQTFTSLPVGNFTFVMTSPIAPLVAFNSNQYVSFGGVDISGSTWSFTFYNTVDGTNATVYGFDFTKKAITNPSTYGLQTFDESGNLLYDAVAGRYMNAPVISECETPYTEATIATVPSGKTYATALVTDSYYFVMSPGIAFTDFPTAKIIGSSVMTASRRVFLGAGPSASGSVKGLWAVIDVTGF